MLDLATGD